MFFLKIVLEQAEQTMQILKGESIEHLLSEKQLALWQWAQSLPNQEFSRQNAVVALRYPERTVESIIKKLLDFKKLRRIGEGRATRYQIVKN